MILNELKAAIESKNGATRQELARRFALSEDGIDAMLAVWIKKRCPIASTVHQR